MVGGVRLVNLSLVLAVLSGSIVVMQQHMSYNTLCYTTLYCAILHSVII